MEEERERWEGGRGTRDRGVFAPGAMYVFKYAYAHEITSRCVVFVTGSLLYAKSMFVCGEILAPVRVLDIYSIRKFANLLV